MTMQMTHIPVLPKQTVDWLIPCDLPMKVIDGTVGFGGHSSLILKKNPSAELLGIDHDDMALDAASQTLSFAGKRVHLVRGNFAKMQEYAQALDWDRVDAILLDIGVSSPQIDNPERGFSFKYDSPLDMRMDRRQSLTAETIVNEYAEGELTKIFREYGELREASKLARMIVEERLRQPLCLCSELASLCDRAVYRPKYKHSGPPAPTLAFQALRIAVNDELGELRRALEAAVELLNPGGRIGVITFHSLEDRIVKHFYQEMAQDCKCPPGCPVCICGWSPKLKILTKKPVEAETLEIAGNPRAACAKLRVAERI